MPRLMLPGLQRQLRHTDGAKLHAGNGVTNREGEYLPLTEQNPAQQEKSTTEARPGHAVCRCSHVPSQHRVVLHARCNANPAQRKAIKGIRANMSDTARCRQRLHRHSARVKSFSAATQ